MATGQRLKVGDKYVQVDGKTYKTGQTLTAPSAAEAKWLIGKGCVEVGGPKAKSKAGGE